MKKSTLAILILLSSLACFGQEYPDSGFTNKAEAKNFVVNGLREGKWCEYLNEYEGYTKDDSTASYYILTIYHKGKPVGIARKYYVNGSLFYKARRINDSIRWVVMYFYEGKQSSADTVFLGAAYYMDNEFYENRHIIHPPTYISDTETGIEKVYYEKGKLLSEIPYKNGKINGLVKVYGDKGEIYGEVPYTNGKKNGTKKAYYQNGKIKWDVPFKDDKMNGALRMYYENGTLESETLYTNGVAGATKNYDENGNEIKQN